MAELAGLALSGGSLASLYSTCVEGFNHVQAARSFGADFESAQLRLDLVQLRFSRWAESTMIDGDQSQRRHGVAVSSTSNENLVKNLLGQISATLEEGKKTAQRYELPESVQQQQQQQVLELDASDTLPSFHQRVRAIARRRQRETSLGKKFMWAISDKDRFNRLVDQVGGFVDQLVGNFPAAREQHDQFIVQEVEEIFPLAESREMKLLQGTANNVDTTFANTVEKQIERAANSHSYEDVRTHGEATIMAGNMYLTGSRPEQPSKMGHSYKNIEFKGKARGVLGDQYGGKGLFD